MVNMMLHILKSCVLYRILGLYFGRERKGRFLPLLIGVYFLTGSMEGLIAWGGRERFLLNAVGLVFLMAAGCAVQIGRAKEASDDEREKEMLQLQLKIYQRQLGALEEHNAVNKVMRHDLKHHARMLADYIVKGENHKALAYLKKMKLYFGGSRQLIETGNGDVDSILNYFMEETYRIGGSATMDVKLVQEFLMDAFDINVLLGNLLLNACEAMKKSEKKELAVAMGYARGVLTVRIRNSYNGILKQEKGKLITTKEEAGSHGVGLASIRRTVEKYDGDMEIRYSLEEFIVKVFLFVPSAGQAAKAK